MKSCILSTEKFRNRQQISPSICAPTLPHHPQTSKPPSGVHLFFLLSERIFLEKVAAEAVVGPSKRSHRKTTSPRQLPVELTSLVLLVRSHSKNDGHNCEDETVRLDNGM